MKKICFAFIAMMLLFCIIGCGKTNDAVDSQQNEANTPVVSADNAIRFDGYRIVRADTSDEAVTAAAVSVRKKLMEMTGANVDLVTDWTNSDAETEIIVGNTNRRTADGYKLDEYRIICEGKTIYILGGSDEAVTAGANYFIENLICENGFLVCDGYLYIYGGVSLIDALSVNGTNIDTVRIFAGEYGGAYAERLGTLITEKVGIGASVSETSTAANIIFVENHDLIDDDKWGVVGDGSSILLVAKDKIEARKAFNYVSEILETSSGTLDFSGVVHSEHQMTEEEFREQKQLVIYPEFPEQIRRIYDYDVSVTMDGTTERLPVYNHVVESNVSRRSGADQYRRFSMFAFSGGQVRVDIKVKQDFTSYTVFPSAKNFKSEFKNGVISVYLDEPDYFGIQLDDNQNTILSVFADYPEFTDLLPDDDDPNFIRIEGWYEPEGGTIIYDKPYTYVYIAPGAVLNARVRFTGDHCTLYGHGAIVDPFENIYEYDIRNGGTESHGFNLLTFKCSNFVSDGPVLLDARCFNIVFGGSNNLVRNMKALSAMMTTDGITTGASNSYVEHCWLYVGDNGIVPSGAKNVVMKDIAIGTTCAALFPQVTVTNLLMEDINIFRADDGIVTNRYNGSSSVPADERTEREVSITFKRLTAVEQTSGKVHFFQGRNMGTLDKIINFEDISVVDTSVDLNFDNGTNNLFTENYTLNFKNIAIGGTIIENASEFSVKNPQNLSNTVTVEYVSGFNPVIRNETVVNYTAEKVYIGARQVFFEKDVIEQNGKIMLPTEEICSLLRVMNISENEYVSTDELIKSKVIESANKAHGDLYLTPVYTGKNLFLEDEGEISYFAEQTCYTLDLVTSEDRDGIIYTVYANPKAPSVSAGISRQITNEIRMYGTGTYKVSFSVTGSENGSLKMILQNDSTSKNTIFGVDEDWTTYSFTIEIGNEDITSDKCMLCFVGEGRVIDEFSFRDFSLTKID